MKGLTMKIRSLPLLIVLLVSDTVLLMGGVATGAGAADLALNCDPCIDRESYKIKAIVHGTKSDKFWIQMQKTAIQAGKDMRVQLEFELYDTYTDETMAKDIADTAALAATKDPDAPDVLIVTIPSPEVEAAIRAALDIIPIFGMNSGYERAESVGLLGFVAMNGTPPFRLSQLL
jgi:ABC-type sugar transport system substrate-binding protein